MNERKTAARLCFIESNPVRNSTFVFVRRFSGKRTIRINRDYVTPFQSTVSIFIQHCYALK